MPGQRLRDAAEAALRVFEFLAHEAPEGVLRAGVAQSAPQRHGAGEPAAAEDEAVAGFLQPLGDAEDVGGQVLAVGVRGHDAAALGQGEAEMVQPRLQRRPFAQVDRMAQDGDAGHVRQAGEDRPALLAAAVVDDDDLRQSPAALHLLHQAHEEAVGIVGGNQRRDVHVRSSHFFPGVVANRSAAKMGRCSSAAIF